MNGFIKTLVIVSLFLCIPAANAQDCNSSELSPQGLEHLHKAIAYIGMMPGTEKQAIAEYEAILQTDSLWCPKEIYSKLGLLCEYIAKKDVSYYNKAIQYYKKYYSFDESDEVKGKIIQLETKKEILGQTLGEDAVKKGVKIEMVFVEGMLNEDTTDCIHSFYIGKHELTQEQWQSVMKNNPSHFRGPNCPVEQICDKYDLFLKELNRITGANYRLPTSTEWFYAARGGKFMENYTYSGGFAENKVAWFSDNSGDRTHEVGEKEPNSLGIYDMSGNVSELVYVDNLEDKKEPVYPNNYNSKVPHTRPRIKGDGDFNSKIAENSDVFPVGGNYRSTPFNINNDKDLSSGMHYVIDNGEQCYVNERRKNEHGFYQDYAVKKIISSHIGIRLVQDADISSMSAEERQWDTWIRQKAERIQKELDKEAEIKAKEQRRQERINLWKNGNRHWDGDYRRPKIQRGVKYDYNFQAYGDLGTESVFVNDLFGHSMLGINVRFPIGAFFYIEPQIKAGIESNWKLVSEQNGFFDQLSACFDNVQTVHLEIPLLIGGIYRFGNHYRYRDPAFAIRGYTGGQFCPVIKTKKAPVNLNTKSYFAVLFGLGIDLDYLMVDLYYRKPIAKESILNTSGFTASFGFLF